MRLLIALSAVAVMCVLFIPFWRIELDAPQYPEGLCADIHRQTWWRCRHH